MSEITREVEKMALEIAQNLHTTKRQGDTVVFQKEKTPQWIKEVILAVHEVEGVKLEPRGTTCRFIEEAARRIANSCAQTLDEVLDEACDLEADVYVYNLLKWARENPNRLYVQLECCAATIAQSLSFAQEQHKREIFDILLNELRARAEMAKAPEDCRTHAMGSATERASRRRSTASTRNNGFYPISISSSPIGCDIGSKTRRHWRRQRRGRNFVARGTAPGFKLASPYNVAD